MRRSIARLARFETDFQKTSGSFLASKIDSAGKEEGKQDEMSAIGETFGSLHFSILSTIERDPMKGLAMLASTYHVTPKLDSKSRPVLLDLIKDINHPILRPLRRNHDHVDSMISFIDPEIPEHMISSRKSSSGSKQENTQNNTLSSLLAPYTDNVSEEDSLAAIVDLMNTGETPETDE